MAGEGVDEEVGKEEEREVDKTTSPDVAGEGVAMSAGEVLFAVVAESSGKKEIVSDVEDGNDPARVLLYTSQTVV